MKSLQQITLDEAHDELVKFILKNGLPMPIPRQLYTEDSITDEDIEVIVDGYINQFINNRVHHFRFILKNIVADYIQQSMGFVSEERLIKSPVTVFKRHRVKSSGKPPTDGNWLSDIDIVKR